jgi:hypothetical protein
MAKLLEDKREIKKKLALARDAKKPDQATVKELRRQLKVATEKVYLGVNGNGKFEDGLYKSGSANRWAPR